jgi:hypothetical protein
VVTGGDSRSLPRWTGGGEAAHIGTRPTELRNTETLAVKGEREAVRAA